MLNTAYNTDFEKEAKLKYPNNTKAVLNSIVMLYFENHLS